MKNKTKRILIKDKNCLENISITDVVVSEVCELEQPIWGVMTTPGLDFMYLTYLEAQYISEGHIELEPVICSTKAIIKLKQNNRN